MLNEAWSTRICIQCSIPSPSRLQIISRTGPPCATISTVSSGWCFSSRFKKGLHALVKLFEGFTAGERPRFPLAQFLGQRRIVLFYLLEGHPFDVAEIAFAELIAGGDRHFMPGGDDFGGGAGATQRAGVNGVDFFRGKPLPQLFRLFFAVIAQGDVGSSQETFLFQADEAVPY